MSCDFLSKKWQDEVLPRIIDLVGKDALLTFHKYNLDFESKDATEADFAQNIRKVIRLRAGEVAGYYFSTTNSNLESVGWAVRNYIDIPVPNSDTFERKYLAFLDGAGSIEDFNEKYYDREKVISDQSEPLDGSGFRDLQDEGPLWELPKRTRVMLGGIKHQQIKVIQTKNSWHLYGFKLCDTFEDWLSTTGRLALIGGCDETWFYIAAVRGFAALRITDKH